MIGKSISRYRILEKLGQGGMGMVYKAHDVRLDRFVALKFLPDLHQGDTDRARLLQEARAAAALSHPNVCVIYEIEETGEHPFIAMELVDGTTLKRKIRNEPLEPAAAVEFAIQIAGALCAAHEKGIVHRDVKSENIMVTGSGQVKVMDFGLARIRGAAKLTRTSSTMGTIAYMPPEVIQGREIDARGDVFSFGVVLYEMLTGRLPFEGEYESAVLYSILNEEPQPVRKFRPDLSSDLLHVLSRALEKDPEERYQSMHDLLIDLKRLKRDAGRVAGEGPRPERPPAGGKRKRKVPLPVAAGLAVVVAAAAVVPFILSRLDRGVSASRPASWANSIAVLPFADVSPERDQEYFSDGMTEEVITHLARNRDLKVISKTSADHFKDSDQSLDVIGEKLGVKNILEGSIRTQDDMIRVTARLIDLENNATLWTDSFDREPKNVFEVQEEIARAISEALQIRFVPSDDPAAPMKPEIRKYYYQGIDAVTTYTLSSDPRDFERAVELVNTALEIDPENALMHVALAWIYNIRYALTWDIAYREPVIRSCVRAYQLDPDLAETKAGMAYALFTQEQYERAADLVAQARALAPNNAEINHLIGILLYSSGLEDRAIRYFEAAAEVNPFNLFTPLMLGHSYSVCGEYPEAESEFRKALELSPASPGPNIALAEVLVILNRPDEAVEQLERAAENPYGELNRRGIMALIHAARGDREEALSARGINDYRKGMLYALLDMREEALACLESGSEPSCLRLTSHPFYQPLRRDERYQAVLKTLKDRRDRMSGIFGDL